jgi:uncharacterized protein involved in type VI secretion and phage assembly
VGEVVERRQQLAPGEVAGGAEDDQRRRVDRQALEAVGQGIGKGRRLGRGRSHSSPPQAIGERPQAGGRVLALECHALGRQGMRAQRLEVADRLACLRRVKP